MRGPFLLILVLMLAVASYGQDRVMFGGVLRNSLTAEPVPAVHVLNLTDSLATITSPEGVFKVPAKVADSLIFSCIGYHTKAMIVTALDLDAEFVEVRLTPRDYMLSEVEVNPFGTKDQFRTRFMELEVDDGTVDIVGIQKPPKDPREIPVTEDANEIKKAKYLLSPASFIYGNLSKDAKARQELHRLEAERDRHKYNYQKFNEPVVHRITGYEGERLLDFMDFCNFSEDQIFRYSEYELTVAILNKQRAFEGLNQQTGN